MNKSIILKYHQDPSHGWVEVPFALVDALGIRSKITGFSYYSQARQVFYLEEDCDLRTLITALDGLGISYSFEDVMYHGSAPMRRLKRVGT